jgi:hypothetical protein
LDGTPPADPDPQEVPMASEGNSSGIVAIFAILMILLVGGFVAWRMGVFGGDGDSTHTIDVNVK